MIRYDRCSCMKNVFRGSGLLVFFWSIVLMTYAGGPVTSRDTVPFPDSLAGKFPGFEENEKCFKCHGSSRYEFENPNTGKTVRRMMPRNKVLSRWVFYRSVHHNFSCTDCHSYDFTKFPHPAGLIFEAYPTCTDCHGGDESFAHYHFEEIEKELRESVHYQQLGDGFTCWDCHNPHGYVPTVRRSDDINEIVRFANDMCLSCHTNFDRFQLLTDQQQFDIVRIHSWLPNQVLHFTKVRCIECHTRINDTILVSHLLLPKDQAVRRCTECHSQNSRLMATLYKFKAREQRKAGFINGVIINESYVIGANRNLYLNRLSIVIMGITLLFILFHVLLRLIISKKQKDDRA